MSLTTHQESRFARLAALIDNNDTPTDRAHIFIERNNTRCNKVRKSRSTVTSRPIS